MRATHSFNVYSRASLESDCSKVDVSVFEGILPGMKSLLKHVDDNVGIKCFTPTPSLAKTVCISEIFESPRPVTRQHPHPQFP